MGDSNKLLRDFFHFLFIESSFLYTQYFYRRKSNIHWFSLSIYRLEQPLIHIQMNQRPRKTKNKQKVSIFNTLNCLSTTLKRPLSCFSLLFFCSMIWLRQNRMLSWQKKLHMAKITWIFVWKFNMWRSLAYWGKNFYFYWPSAHLLPYPEGKYFSNSLQHTYQKILTTLFPSIAMLCLWKGVGWKWVNIFHWMNLFLSILYPLCLTPAFIIIEDFLFLCSGRGLRCSL